MASAETYRKAGGGKFLIWTYAVLHWALPDAGISAGCVFQGVGFKDTYLPKMENSNRRFDAAKTGKKGRGPIISDNGYHRPPHYLFLIIFLPC